MTEEEKKIQAMRAKVLRETLRHEKTMSGSSLDYHIDLAQRNAESYLTSAQEEQYRRNKLKGTKRWSDSNERDYQLLKNAYYRYQDEVDRLRAEKMARTVRVPIRGVE